MQNIYHDLAYGATADLMIGKPFTLLTRLAVQKRGQGAGKRLMERVLTDADEEGIDLMLSVDPSPGIDEARLRAWYQRLGFQQFAPDDPNTLVRYCQLPASVGVLLEAWEDACVFAHGNVDALPALTATRLIDAGDQLAEVIRSHKLERKHG
jgi:predicted N-acetyltransferase YhbS